MTQNRLQKLRALLAKAGLDALFVSNESNVRYLSGYTNHEAYLLLFANGTNILITDFRYAETAESECPQYTVATTTADCPLIQILQDNCRSQHVQKLGFEPDFVSYSLYSRLQTGLQNLELLPTPGLPEQLRYVKDAEEISALRYACAATDRVFAALCNFIHAGQSEREVRWQLLSLINEEGCGSSFSPIVVSGARSSLPHGMASEKRLEKGDFLTMDFGCLYKGYHADMTRTVVIGQPDTKQIDIYNIVLEAHMRGLAGVHAHITGREADAVARSFIAAHGYGACFGHGMGHGVGLDIHEAPTLNPHGEMVLQSGCFVTVEPGIYLPGWGGVRIEDTVLVTETGCESMFCSPKELLCL